MCVLGFESAVPKPFLPRVGNVFRWKLDCLPLTAAISSIHVVAMLIGRDAATDKVECVDYLVSFNFIVKVYRSGRG